MIFNFNSFLKHVTLIYVSGSVANIQIDIMVINQAYLPRSFIFAELGVINLDLKNLYFQAINEFYVITFPLTSYLINLGKGPKIR